MPGGQGAGPTPLSDPVFAASTVSASPRASRADGLLQTATGHETDASVDVVPYAVLA